LSIGILAQGVLGSVTQAASSNDAAVPAESNDAAVPAEASKRKRKGGCKKRSDRIKKYEREGLEEALAHERWLRAGNNRKAKKRKKCGRRSP
jgi:hypothetical protein